MRNATCILVVVFTGLAAGAAYGQTVVLDDSLRGSTSGTQRGGAFQTDGWRVTSKDDSITWHIQTLSHGAAEWSVRGLRPNDDRAEGYDKNELFHMYDWTYNNADTVYDGYRNNPYKHFVRKINVLDSGKTDMMELVWAINGDYVEPDTSKLSWDPNVTYRFREEWGPDGTGRSVIRTYRDGTLIMTMAVSGSWTPSGHAVRIAASTRAPLYSDFGAPVDAVFSDLKVWDLTGTAPPAPPPPSSGPPTLGISGDKFTLNGTLTFLLGVSYFDGANWYASDLDALAARRFNLIRIWLDWGVAGDGRSFFDSSGALVKRDTLLSLVRAAGARGMVVDVTVLDPTPTFSNLSRALREAASALKDEPNVFFDVMNEHDHGAGPQSHTAVAGFVSDIRSVHPGAIVTVSSTGGHLMSTTNIDEEMDAGINIVTPHFERTSDWYDRTDDRTRFVKNHIASRGRNLPVYLQEEARRGHSGLNPSRDEFFQAARECRDAGGAGWILHTRAGFDLNVQTFFSALDAVEREVVDGLADVIFGPGGGGTPPPSGGGSSLATGWEDGEPLGLSDTVAYSKDVNGFFNSQSPPPECSRRSGETERTGAYSLMIAGYSNASYAYCYYKVFDDNLSIQPGTKIKYWIYHQSTSKIAVDGHFTDGSTIRDGGFTDQNGVGIHPAARTDPLGVWHYVEVDLSAAAGKTLDFILIGFDNGGNGFTGSYRAYVDDFSIGAAASGLRFHLQASNGQYVVAEGAGGGAVNANRDAAGSWETFTLVDLNGGTLNHGDAIRILTDDGSHYFIAYSGGTLDAASTNPGPWEVFTVERRAGAGTVADGDGIGLKSAHGLYAVAEGGGGGVVNANRTAFGSWEEFRFRLAGSAPAPSPPAPAPTAPSGPFVSVVSISTGGPTSIDTAQAGALPYSDRSYTIGSISSRLDGGVLVRVPNSDKYNRDAAYLTLSVSQDAYVYVAYDRRGAGVLPSWLDDETTWSLTGESLSTSDSGASPMVVYSRRASAGNVTLGGNWEGRDTGAQSNYVVVVQPATAPAPGGGLEEPALGMLYLELGPIASGSFVSPGDADGDGLRDAFEQAYALDPSNIFTKATGVPDEVALYSDGRTYFEVQSGGPLPLGGGGGGGGGGGACGATGMEIVVILGILAVLRRK